MLGGQQHLSVRKARKPDHVFIQIPYSCSLRVYAAEFSFFSKLHLPSEWAMEFMT